MTTPDEAVACGAWMPARCVSALKAQGIGWPSRPQQRLLAALCGPPEAARASWREWRARVDFDALEPASLRLLPLLRERLIEWGLEDRESGRLRGLRRHTWVSNQYQLRVGYEVATQLSAADIPVCALKGFALLHDAPARLVGFRPMFDVDLLVPPDRVAHAFALLESNGWVGTPRLSPGKVTGDLLSAEHGHAFRRGHGNIDLHWHVAHQDRSTFFDRIAWTHAGSLGGCAPTRLLKLSPTEHLLHVCLHGVRADARATRVWALDARDIVENASSEIDWARLGNVVVRRRLIAPAADALLFLATLTDCVPARWLADIAREPIHVAELAEYRMIAGVVAPNDLLGRAAVDLMNDLRRRFEEVPLSVVDARAVRSGFHGEPV